MPVVYAKTDKNQMFLRMSWVTCSCCNPGLHKSIPQTDAHRISFVRKL
jgi:hypothetical protein